MIVFQRRFGADLRAQKACSFFKTAVTIAAAAVGLLSSLHAAAGLLDDDVARKDIKDLRAQTEQQNRDSDAKFLKLEESIKNIGIIGLLNQIEQLNAEIARLRGQIEVLGNQNDQFTKRQKDFYLDIDTRLRKLEGLPPDTAAAAPTSPAGAVPVAAPPANAVPTSPPALPPTVPTLPRSTNPVLNKEQENRAYDVGSNLFRRGDFVAAIRAFETFAKDYPASGLVSNAQYWIGIGYFNLKDFANARATQEALVRTFPDSPKAPDALLAIANIQLESGDNGSARNTLEDIIARFPTSDAATKARSRLALVKR